MSLEQHTNALLKGFQPPVFPSSLMSLAQMLVQINGSELGTIGRELPGCTCVKSFLETSDGYSWYRCMFFGSGGEICIAIPWCQDWEKTDGFQSDRSPAVYVSRPDVPLEKIDGIIERLVDRLVEYKRVGR
ncbi:MAG: hypothetical protein PHS79_05090 [Patescibacteria group bacterium]|nr:hypothetical protein [Patescibacteria group bacterium]